MADLKIIDKWYVGFNYSVPVPISTTHETKITGSATKKYPMGFMTPDGDDSAAKKRKMTVDNWSDNISPKITVDSVPVSGYRLLSLVGRYSRDSNQDKWKIFDPRGFVLEITSGNLAALLDHCDLKDGVFEGKLLWARDGGNNRLIAENSKPHLAAIANTQKVINTVKAKKISKKDLVIGDIYKVDSGTLQYVGEYYTLASCPKNRYPYATSKNKLENGKHILDINIIDDNGGKKSLLFLYESTYKSIKPELIRYNTVPTNQGLLKRAPLDPKIKENIEKRVYSCRHAVTYTHYHYSENKFTVKKVDSATYDTAKLKEELASKNVSIYLNEIKSKNYLFFVSKIAINSYTYGTIQLSHVISRYAGVPLNYARDFRSTCINIIGDTNDFNLTNKLTCDYNRYYHFDQYMFSVCGADIEFFNIEITTTDMNGKIVIIPPIAKK